MEDLFDVAGPNRAVEILGLRLVGVNAENAKKLLVTVVFVLIVIILVKLLRAVVRGLLHDRVDHPTEFWARQGINLTGAVLLLFGIASIWFDDPTRLATALGLITAGLAFALQKVISAIAGYFVILRGKTFSVGDRIVMGGVRGDVIALDFTQTSIMEMGQPPPVQKDDPAMWVQSRQYTGRIVTVSNARIFDEPVYNYTREFPFLWEELQVPVPYTADRETAERIVLHAASRHSVSIRDLSEDALREMQRRFFMNAADVKPRTYVRLTDNWIELTVRFVARDHGIRELKDAISRDILAKFKEEGIEVASATLQVSTAPAAHMDYSGSRH